MQLLYDYILQRGTIVPIREYNADLLKVFLVLQQRMTAVMILCACVSQASTCKQYGDVSRRVQELLRAGSPDWECMVPRHVANQIKAQQLLGYRSPDENTPASQGAPSPNGDDVAPPKQHTRTRKPKATAA